MELNPVPNPRTNGVWCEAGTEPPVVESVKHSKRLSFCGTVSEDGPGPLVGFEGSFTEEGDLKGLKLIIPMLKKSKPAGFVLQQDGTSVHQTKSAIDYLREEKVDFISSGRNGFFPAQSPDFQLIENVIGYTKRHIEAKQCQYLSDLARVTSTVWKEIPPSYCKKLFDSLPRRWAACVSNTGGSTKY